jgi:MinD superfamily P-loop ATPase
MKILAVHSPQAGSGKTSLAKALAALGYGYSSIDPLDPVDLVSGQESQDLLIVDTPPHWSGETVDAVANADALIIPIKSAAPWALQDLKARLVQVLDSRIGKKTILVCTDASDVAQNVMNSIKPLLGPDVIAFPEVISVSGGNCDQIQIAQLVTVLV